MLGLEDGAPPPVDLEAERAAGDCVRGLIADGHVAACHDVSDGGLAVALAEMAMAGGIGATVDIEGAAGDLPPHAFLFGEDQARYLLAVAPEAVSAVEAACREAEIALVQVGESGGDALKLGDLATISLRALCEAHEAWMPAYVAADPATGA